MIRTIITANRQVRFRGMGHADLKHNELRALGGILGQQPAELCDQQHGAGFVGSV